MARLVRLNESQLRKLVRSMLHEADPKMDQQRNYVTKALASMVNKLRRSGDIQSEQDVLDMLEDGSLAELTMRIAQPGMHGLITQFATPDLAEIIWASSDPASSTGRMPSSHPSKQLPDLATDAYGRTVRADQVDPIG